MPDKVIDLHAKEPHVNRELACLGCHHRWIGVCHHATLLKDLRCPCCERTGFAVNTGETQL